MTGSRFRAWGWMTNRAGASPGTTPVGLAGIP